MNPLTPSSPEPDDEVVSAAFDGEATPQERARVAGDPDLQQRLRQFEAVAARLRADEPAPADRLDALVVAALATAEEPVDPPASGSGGRRARAHRSRGRLLAAAAALLVVVGLAVGLLASRTQRTSFLTASGSKSSTADSGDAAAKALAAAAAAGDRSDESSPVPASPQAADQTARSGTTQVAATVDLGSFDDAASLLAAVRSRSSSPVPPAMSASTTAAPSASPTRSAGPPTASAGPPTASAGPPTASAGPPAAACAVPAGGEVLGAADLAGRRLLVVLLDGAGGARVLGLDATTCTAVLDEPL